MKLLRAVLSNVLPFFKSTSLFLVVLAGASVLFAQDPGTMAAQQQAQMAADAAQQANQQAMQAAQTASQQASQASQIDNSVPVGYYTQAPTFSVRAGNVQAGTTVRLKSSTHYAVIYYTTNGWTPTVNSKRYTGPIKIEHSVELQAIAIAPNATRSLIASAKYTVQGAQKKVPEPIDVSDGVLHAGTRLHLVTDQAITSKTAQIGDPIKLVLNQDVRIGDDIIVPKGTPVDATITQADRAGHAGIPGDVAFEIHFLSLDGRQIPLEGGESLEGANHYTRAKSLLVIPVVGVAGLVAHGDEAQITPGMPLTAAVAEDTVLQP